MAIRHENGGTWISGKDLDALLNRVAQPTFRKKRVLFPIKENTIINDIPVEPDRETLAYLKSGIPSKSQTKIIALRNVS